MTKQQFLEHMREKLTGLPQEDINKLLDYYMEIIDDHIEDGLSEESAVEALGDVDDIISQILRETPLPKLVKEKVKRRRVLKTGEIILLILGSPLWISLLLAVIAVILSLYIVLWAAIAALYAIDISVAAAAVGAFFAAGVFINTDYFVQAALFFGGGLVCIGLAVLLFFFFNQVAKSVIVLSKKIATSIKSCFIGRRVAQ